MNQNHKQVPGNERPQISAVNPGAISRGSTLSTWSTGWLAAHTNPQMTPTGRGEEGGITAARWPGSTLKKKEGCFSSGATN